MSLFEHSFYVGNGIGCILYGVNMSMYYITIKNTIHCKSASSKKRLVTYFMSTALLLLLSIELAANAIFGDQAWITFRGNASDWMESHQSVWYETVGTTALAILIFFSDAFLIYRFFVFYGSRIYTLIIPCTLYSVAIVFAVMEDIVAAKSSFFSTGAIKFGLPYYCLSITLNIYTTSAIVWRLIRISRGLRQTLGTHTAQKYTGVASLLIESAALYSFFGIVMIIPYGLNHPTAPAFAQAWSKLAAICPQLIMLRLSSNTGWSTDTIERVQSDIVFAKTETGQTVE